MPSQLFKNEGISFVCAKNFRYRGEEYEVGDDFPQETANNIETMVRARFVIPVVEELSEKPRHWHRHIRPRAEVLERIHRSRVQLVMPHEYDSDEEVNLDVLTHPERTEEPVGVAEEEAGVDEDQTEAYDPGEHTVAEVQAYLVEHPEERDDVVAAEEAGRGRKGILEA